MRNRQLGPWQAHGALRTATMSYPPGLAIAGDIDEETYSALIEALFKLAGNTAGLHIDLSAVNFCDVAGLHSIIQPAGAGLPVILHGVPAPLRTVMRVLGWDDTPGLVISKRQHRHSCPAVPAGRPGWRAHRWSAAATRQRCRSTLRSRRARRPHKHGPEA
jgi:ABC-type transporter Mla MlaB component